MLSQKEKKQLFDLIKKEIEKVNLYELNFNFYLVYTTDTDLTTLLENSDDWFNKHNTLYKTLYNQAKDVITSIDFTISEVEKDIYKIQINNIPNTNIYM